MEAAEFQFKRIGDLLIEGGYLSQDDLNGALEEQKKTGERMGNVLIRLNLISEEILARVLEHQFHIPYARLSEQEIDPKVVTLLPLSFIKKEGMFPLQLQDDQLVLAIVDPLNQKAIAEVRRKTGLRVTLVLTTPSELQTTIETRYQVFLSAGKALKELQTEVTKRVKKEEEAQKEQTKIKAREEAYAIINVVDSILSQAISERASDIHLEPSEEEMLVRFRIDGVLYNMMRIPKEVMGDVVIRIKVVGGMDITEHRFPQDGTWEVNLAGRAMDLRLSCFPSAFGEKIVIRLLDKEHPLVGLEKLGFSQSSLTLIRRIIEKPYGLFLITGPTGSGKTTTLYSILQILNRQSVNIIAIEDPIEYKFKGITQMQVNPKIHLSFAQGIRAALRQDPDIILVGEIRDLETLEVAIQASMTGHLVFATLHTNDALSAVARMEDLGIKPYLIFAGTIGVMAQRLVRKLCPVCKIPTELPLAVPDGKMKAYKAGGCRKCKFRGYHDRIAAAEIAIFDKELVNLFLNHAPLPAIKEACREKGMIFLADDGMEKVREGLTSYEEVRRVIFTE